jgi:AraC-like DNA-binding protein
MDPLSEIMGTLKPNVQPCQAVRTSAPMNVRFPATEHLMLCQLLEGSCRAELPGAIELAMDAGDTLLLRGPSSWLVRIAGGGASVELRNLVARWSSEHMAAASAASPGVRLLTAQVVFEAPEPELVGALFPPVLQVRRTEAVGTPLCTVLRLLEHEAAAGEPGHALVCSHLLEVLLVMLLRHRCAHDPGLPPGILAGLADERIGSALQAMHLAPEHAWTVAELARQVELSRSTFAARFTARVGSSPLSYLLGWRMRLAKASLSEGSRSVADIAALTGYSSVSAFSTAFSRATGLSPSAYGRLAAS